MTLKTASLGAAAALLVLLAACAETPQESVEAQSPAAAAQIGSEASARSPMTVNPEPKAGAPIPETPPTLPQDPAADKDMPPGPVNPGA